MKRLLLILLAGFLINAYVLAQWDDYDYDSEDYDDYDQPAAGASGTNASGSNASGSNDIIVRNPGNEDVSEQTLTLPNSQPIYLYFYNSVQQPAPPERAAQPRPAEPAPPAEPVYTPPLPIERNPPPAPPPVEYRYIPSPPVEYWYIPPPQVEYRYIPLPPSEPAPPPPPSLNIRVIPALPDPNSSRVYRLQVGAYSVYSTADRIAQQLRAAGLQAGIENYNSLTRVFVPDVRAADAASTAQMLELLGFKEVWIRE